MPVSQFLRLIFCNVIWSGSYTASKYLLLRYHPLEVSFLRSLIALLILLPLSLRGGSRSKIVKWALRLQPVDFRLFIVGVLTFFFSPFMQMNGLHYSRAVDGSVLIAMEPLVTIVVAGIILRERLKGYQLLSLAVAIIGAFILTEVSWTKLITFSDTRMLGNLIMLCSYFGEAGYSIISKPALDRRDPLVFLVVSVGIGALCILAYNLIHDGPARASGLVPLIEDRNLIDWALVLYLGGGCTAFAYLYWMLILKDAPVSAMAITLYVQPVLGALWGFAFLKESLTVATFVGGGLIFVALAVGSIPPAHWSGLWRRITRRIMI